MSISRTIHPIKPLGLAASALAAAALLGSAAAASAQQSLLDGLIPAGGATATGRIVQLVSLLTVLSVAPGLLIMVTSFTRFVIALSFLRSGLGLQSTPANLVLISLALFMTFYVMAPTFDQRLAGRGPAAARQQDHRGGGLSPGSPSRSARSCWRRCGPRI